MNNHNCISPSQDTSPSQDSSNPYRIEVLPYHDKPLSEIRPAYFLKAFGENPPDMRIFSLGKCNYNCPYCKRGGNHKEDVDENLMIAGAQSVSVEYFMDNVNDAINKNQVVRLSGGDPVCYPNLSLEVVKYVKERGGRTSIAHNGSGPKFAERLAPYLDFASIDFKASTPEGLAHIAGVDASMGEKLFNNTIKTISTLASAEVKTDVRTPVFESTTENSLETIAEKLSEANTNNIFWTLRTYSPVEGSDEKPKTEEEMYTLATTLSAKYPQLKIGLRAKWEPEGFLYFKNGQQVNNF